MIFSIFFLGMFATAAYGYSQGNPNKLITPFDSQGNQCGINNTYQYLYWPEIFTGVKASISNSSTIPSITITSNMLGKALCVK
jgi:hypothetical protein